MVTFALKKPVKHLTILVLTDSQPDSHHQYLLWHLCRPKNAIQWLKAQNLCSENIVLAGISKK